MNGRRATLLAAPLALASWAHEPSRKVSASDARPDTVVAPVYTPEQALERFRLVEGYRIELVAAEPLVQDPIAIDFDADGRMYVVEMRGYMPNVQGTGEDRAVGRIVVLEDTNDDGRMDRSVVFMDSLVLPRAVKVLARGVLVAAPPNLWLARDTTGDLRADTRELVRSDYGDPAGNPEHNANGLLWGIDNWIHNANYPGQFRAGAGGTLSFRRVPQSGQWGVSSDEWGRLYRNSNEDPLRSDLVASHYALRNTNIGSMRGVYERLTANVAVWPAHKTPGVNRGYRAQTLRADSTLAHYTAAGSPTAFVGDRLPAELRQSVFISESAGNMVGRLIVSERDDGFPVARPAYERREFLTADDERFRPVNLSSAPDGTLYIVDMYRGIIQHRTFITGYLERKIAERGLEQPVGMGRIWRVVHASTPRGPTPRLAAAGSGELVQQLAHPNGWWRLTAQRLLVERGDTSIVPALRTMAGVHADPRARLHALWTLDGLNRADRADIEAALRDTSAPVRAAAIRIAEPMLATGDPEVRDALLRLIDDRHPAVRRQLAASLGELPADARENAVLSLIARAGDDPVIADLVVSALARRELPFLERVLAHDAASAERRAPSLRSLARAVMTSRDAPAVQRIVSMGGDRTRARWQRLALLDGLRRPTGQQGGFVVALAAGPSGLVAATTSADTALRARAVDVASSLSWPGSRAAVAGVAPLTAAERQRFVAGQAVFASTCAGCHQLSGAGLAGVARPLVGSPWVLGAPERLVRIVLHGKEGTMLMPPLGASMNDDQIASVLTYVRRAWGNGASAMTPASIQEIRGNTTGRTRPWTEDELMRARR